MKMGEKRASAVSLHPRATADGYVSEEFLRWIDVRLKQLFQAPHHL